MQIINSSKNTVLSSNCSKADSFWLRFKGLMGKAKPDDDGGLIITPCNSIHMFFMKFPIDAVFIDKENKVVYLADGIEPWQVSPVIRKARSVIELPVGTIKRTHTQIGDILEIK